MFNGAKSLKRSSLFILIVILDRVSATAAAQDGLFATNLPELKWVEFSAKGFEQPVSGVLCRVANPPCCGVPLGGIDTGCIDIDARGVYGFSSIFHPDSASPRGVGWRVPRRLIPDPQPILGLSLDGKTWVLATKEFVDGNTINWCTEPDFYGVLTNSTYKPYKVNPTKILNVVPARQIYYWGHYPVADMEFGHY